MSAADSEHIAFARLAELLFDISDAVDRIGSNPLEWHCRDYGACDHCRRKLWFGRKACVGRHICGFQTIWILGPFFRKIQRAIDERMAMTRNVSSEDADLAVRNLACRTGVLPRHTARRLALLEKAGLVDDEDRIVICQMLDDIVAHDIAQGISIPIPATQDCLLPPWTRIASRLRAHPTGLALLIAEQTFQKQGLRSSQHVPARTTDVSASSPHEATQPITQAFLQSTLPASTIFESWLPMDSEIVRKGNCNARAPVPAAGLGNHHWTRLG